MVQSPREPNDPLLHVLVVVHSLQEQGKDDRVINYAAMAAAVASTEASYRDQALHARNLHGVDQDGGRLREQRCVLEDGLRRDVDAESLDDHVHALEGAPDRAAIERVAGHLLQSRVLDWYTHRFESDATAGTNDENFGHALSYLVSVQCRQAGHVLRALANEMEVSGRFMSWPRRAGAQAVKIRGF